MRTSQIRVPCGFGEVDFQAVGTRRMTPDPNPNFGTTEAIPARARGNLAVAPLDNAQLSGACAESRQGRFSNAVGCLRMGDTQKAFGAAQRRFFQRSPFGAWFSDMP